MANRRMFSKDVVEADAFIDLPLSAQALYLHLGMAADDEGFVSGPRSIQRMIGASDDDAALLVRKGYVIPFPSGVVVITHWRQNNYLQKDRAKPTLFTDEKAALMVDNKKIYALVEKSTKPEPCIQNVYKMYTQNRIEENSIDKREGIAYIPARAREAFGQFKKVWLTPAEHESLKATYRNSHKLIDHVDRYLARSGKIYENHYALIVSIAEDDGWPKKPRTEDPTDPAEGAAIPAGDEAKGLTAEQEAAMDRDVEAITKRLAAKMAAERNGE